MMEIFELVTLFSSVNVVKFIICWISEDAGCQLIADGF